MKTCPTCQSEFKPSSSMQKYCGYRCTKTTRKAAQKPVKRKVKLSTLQAKADSLMSEYIRRKYADEHGYVTCVSCGRSFRWQEVDCGHFVSRRHLATRYVEENAHPECKGCNRFSTDHLIGYTTYIIDLYGREKIAELKKESRKVLSPSEKRKTVEEAYQYYLNALTEL